MLAGDRIGASVADPRSDIFSLGVVLHEMLAGNRPVADGATDFRDPPPGFSPVLTRPLDPSPEHRFTTMADLSSALAQLTAKMSSAPAADTAAAIHTVSRAAERQRVSTVVEAIDAEQEFASSVTLSNYPESLRPSDASPGEELANGAVTSPAVLTFMDGGETRSVTLPRTGQISLGRGPSNDLVLHDRTVSRSHARIRAAND